MTLVAKDLPKSDEKNLKIASGTWEEIWGMMLLPVSFDGQRFALLQLLPRQTIKYKHQMTSEFNQITNVILLGPLC